FLCSATYCLISPHLLISLPATTGIYSLSLHDALPISLRCLRGFFYSSVGTFCRSDSTGRRLPSFVSSGLNRIGVIFIPLNVFVIDRKSTRLNSSHVSISYAVFCLKKKK